MKKKIIALLPLKENSERIKNKNFKIFCGKPLFHWMLSTLIAIDEIDEIIINTDAPEKIMGYEISQNPKVFVRNRLKELCGDDVSMNKIINDDIKNIDADIYLMTHATNPLLKSKTIIGAINEYINNEMYGYDSLFSVNKFQSRFYDINCLPINHDPNILMQTQSLPPIFEENSNLYIFNADSFMKNSARIGISPKMYEISKIESVDIDNDVDWIIAESLCQFERSSIK